MNQIWPRRRSARGGQQPSDWCNGSYRRFQFAPFVRPTPEHLFGFEKYEATENESNTARDDPPSLPAEKTVVLFIFAGSRRAASSFHHTAED